MVKIAIFGTSGLLGAPFLEALKNPNFRSKVEFPVLAVTSKDKSKESTDDVKFIQSDLKNPELVDELKGTDVIISLIQPEAEPLDAIYKIIAQVRPKLYIPSEFGCEVDAIESDILHVNFVNKIAHASKVKSEGIKVVKIGTGLFRAPPIFLYAFTDHVGILQKDGVFKIVGDEEDKVIFFSTLQDVGNVIAAVATTEPSQLKDLYTVSSGQYSVKKLLEDIEKEKGQKFSVQRLTLDEQIKEQKASPENFGLALFTYFSSPVGHGGRFKLLDNELVNPKESLWKWGSW